MSAPPTPRPAERDPAWRHRPKVWTPATRDRLCALLEAGQTDAQIAHRLGVSRNAVKLARRRYGLPKRADVLLTARGVARLLGLPCSKAVGRWMANGWITAHRGHGAGAHRVWWTTEPDVLDFLDDERFWHVWQTDRIADPDLRAWATERRAGVRFLTVGEVAARFCVEPGTAWSWMRKGQLPAVRWGNWRVREADVEAFELPRIGGRPRRKEGAA